MGNLWSDLELRDWIDLSADRQPDLCNTLTHHIVVVMLLSLLRGYLGL